MLGIDVNCLLDLSKQLKKINRSKLRIILRKFQPNFKHYVKKTEALAKIFFSKETCSPWNI